MIDWSVIEIAALMNVVIAVIVFVKNWFTRYLDSRFELKSAQHQLLFAERFASKEELHELRQTVEHLHEQMNHRKDSS